MAKIRRIGKMVTMGTMMMVMMMMMMVMAALVMVWLMLLDSVHDQEADLHYMTKPYAFMLHCLSKQGFLPVAWSSSLQIFGVSGTGLLLINTAGLVLSLSWQISCLVILVTLILTYTYRLNVAVRVTFLVT